MYTNVGKIVVTPNLSNYHFKNLFPLICPLITLVMTTEAIALLLSESLHPQK